MGRLHSGSPGASFHGRTHLALDFRPSDRLDIQSGGGGRSIERLLQGRHANWRPGTLRRRYLHSDRLCSDTAHQSRACLHDPFEGGIGSKKIVTRARARIPTSERPFRANCPTGKSKRISRKSKSIPNSKNISLRRLLDTALLIPAVPPHQEGRFAIVTKRWAGEGGEGFGAVDECTNKQTAKKGGAHV